MRTAFTIYIRAVGIYMLITLPVLLAPMMYIISAIYVLLFGWFAWGLFTLLYVLIMMIRQPDFRMGLTLLAVIPSVAFAYHMIGVFDPSMNVWNAGGFMLFPIAGVFAGWISTFYSTNAVRSLKIRV